MRTLLVLLLAPLLSLAVASDTPPGTAAPPSAAELKALISGNSATGNWEGRPYKQYFSANGSTRYDEEGRRPSSGSWRINEKGQYCSTWPPSSNETCYNVLVNGQTIYWSSRGGYQKASVVPGNIFH